MIALLLDTETSGLVDNMVKRAERQPEVMEFYACLVDLTTGEITDDFDTLIKPARGIPDHITKITGLSNATVAEAPPFGFVADRIARMIESAPLCIGHNMTYDHDMLDIEFGRLGRTLCWPRLLCTIEATMHLKGYRLSMAELHKLLFDEDFAGAHRAKVDVMALLRCCMELHRRDLL